MKIGELSTTARTPVETIRYCERIGVLPEPSRSGGNFRPYEAPHLERLQLCRSLDMLVAEIRQILLKFKDAPDACCGDIDANTSAASRAAFASCTRWRHS